MLTARPPSSPLSLRCRKTCLNGQSGTGRLTLSVSLRPPNLRPFKLAPLGNTVAVSRLQPFSVSLRKSEDSTLSSPTAPEWP